MAGLDLRQRIPRDQAKEAGRARHQVAPRARGRFDRKGHDIFFTF